MPLISGGGGLPFNGGTITQPLVIDLSASGGGTIPLQVVASWNAQSQDFFQVVNSDTGTRMLAVDVQGGTVAWPHTSEVEKNLESVGGAVQGKLPGVEGAGATGSRTLGLFDHILAAQPSVTSGTVTPEQLALALQTYGALGGS